MNDILDKLDTKRAELIYIICERRDIIEPNMLLQIIYEIRSITQIIKLLKGGQNEK